MVSQIDLFTSIASLVGSNDKGEDSKNLLPVFLGESNAGREELVLEATTRTAFRKGDWVMIPPYKGPAINKFVNIELGNDTEYQLFNLGSDLSQTKNLATTEPDKLKSMIADFEAIRGTEYGKIEALKLK